MDNKQYFQEIINWTLTGLTFYYRDCELSHNIINKYKKGLIFRSATFVDCSSVAGFPTTNCRFIFASSKGIPLYQLNPETEKWRLCTINANSCFKVLDVYVSNGITQILVLHIPAKGLEIFENIEISIGANNLFDEIIEKSRKSLEDKLNRKIILEFEDIEWIKRTEFPIGLDSNNDFFPLAPNQQMFPEAKSLYEVFFKLSVDTDLNKFEIDK